MFSRTIAAAALLVCATLLAFGPTPISAATALPVTYCGTTTQGCAAALGLALATNRSAYSVGDPVMFMLRSYTNATSGVNVVTAYNKSAVFFPRVDDYTNFTIPGSYGEIQTGTQGASVSLALIQGGRMFELPMKRWWSAQKSAYISWRSVVVTMINGIITEMEWEPTKCYFADCDCLDDLCPVACAGTSTACNIQVHVMWGGTDVNGKPLSSNLRSIWKLQNVI
ncbi:hypothetical protein BC828DRAFT_417907 [Blastocladiella britannica]|nr:hypothetical protein BC828DRAFT_417907 [Blastocladiella britannica]